jgi:PBP1b-binding outer membrane lipoprotein LpoB
MASDGRVILEMETIANRTDQHLNTDELTSTMRNILLNTGLIQFTNEDTLRRDVEITNRGMDGLADPDQAPKAGKQVVSNLRLYGHISSERTQQGRTKRNQYKFSVFIKNTETGLLEWSAEEYIIKQGKQPIL